MVFLWCFELAGEKWHTKSYLIHLVHGPGAPGRHHFERTLRHSSNVICILTSCTGESVDPAICLFDLSYMSSFMNSSSSLKLMPPTPAEFQN
jgi:hypothetical protein